MKVVIYRPDTSEQDSVAVALLGTPKWAMAELLPTVGLEGGIDVENFPIRGDDSWRAMALETPDDESSPARRIDNEESGFAEHSLGAVLVVLPTWNAGGPLPALIGQGWWRFLSPAGESALLIASDGGERPATAPMIFLENRERNVVACETGAPLMWSRGLHEGRVHLADPVTKDVLAGTYFMLDSGLDGIACAVLQSLSEVLRVCAIGVQRFTNEESGDIENYRFSLLLLDAPPEE